MVSLVNSMHRLRHTQSFSREHFISSTTFSDRNDEFTISSKCESRMNVDPALKFLGITENTSSMPPVFGEPYPIFILILHGLNGTSICSNWCSFRSRCASTVECVKVAMIFRWVCQALWKWAYRFQAGKKNPYHSRVPDSRIKSTSIPVRKLPVLTVSGSRRSSRWDIYREWVYFTVRLHEALLIGMGLIKPAKNGELSAVLALPAHHLWVLALLLGLQGVPLRDVEVVVKSERFLKSFLPEHWFIIERAVIILNLQCSNLIGWLFQIR